MSLGICREKAGDSWFGGSPTRGLGEISTRPNLADGQLTHYWLVNPSWNALQIAFHRLFSGILTPDSWFGGN